MEKLKPITFKIKDEGKQQITAAARSVGLDTASFVRHLVLREVTKMEGKK